MASEQQLLRHLERASSDIGMIARRFATGRASREDLRQEMLCHMLTLPEGQARRFYLKSLRRCAYNYWARKIVDAPSSNTGKVLLDRQTVAVGGLAELDFIHQRQAA
jgi:hypothetical protein